MQRIRSPTLPSMATMAASSTTGNILCKRSFRTVRGGGIQEKMASDVVTGADRIWE
jgi:hypothetical protein